MKSKILFVGDAGCPTGFARSTHEILRPVAEVCDVTVLGIGYTGDPHPWPYPIYSAAVGGDGFGVGRLAFMCDLVKSSVQCGTQRETVGGPTECSGPDVIVIQNDGWNIPFYVQELAKTEYRAVPVVAIVAVDGKNFDGRWLNGVSLAIFWTQFALDEAREGGYVGPAKVIPLGVDLEMYFPIDKREARRLRRIEILSDAFIVGNVNRNQPRKRWDLTIEYFAEWVYGRCPRKERTEKNRVIDDAWLYLHSAPTGDTAVDARRLAEYYGIADRLALLVPTTFHGLSEEEMRETYNCFDVLVSTTQGEGMGLTALEAMACGVACALPRWSAFGDWAEGAAVLVPCTSTCVGSPYVNVVGGVADEAAFIRELDNLYRLQTYRQPTARRGLARAREQRFRWENIGQAFLAELTTLLDLVASWKEAPVGQ